MFNQPGVMRSVAKTTSLDQSGDASFRSTGWHAGEALGPTQPARRSAELSPLVAVLPELRREALEGLYAIRLTTKWLEARVESDPESRAAIALIRQSEADLRRMFDRTRLHALEVLAQEQ